MTGTDKYFGWPCGQNSYSWWKQKLADMYNAADADTGPFGIWVGSVPGYERKSWFLNIPLLAQMIFDMRTTPVPVAPPAS